MAAFSSWVDGNFNLIQSVGIIGGLMTASIALFANAAASNRDAKAKERDNILTLSEHHRNLWWGEISKNQKLLRIFQTDVDVLKEPATLLEEVYLNETFAQYLTGWRIAKAEGLTTLNELAIDVKWFFSLPLPRVVWEKSKKYRNRRFVQFVKEALEKYQ